MTDQYKPVHTYSEIARTMDISVTRVIELEKNAMAKLKKAVANDPYLRNKLRVQLELQEEERSKPKYEHSLSKV